MPTIIAEKHDSYLMGFKEESNSFNKPRLLFAKNKNKFIFPIYLNVKVIVGIMIIFII